MAGLREMTISKSFRSEDISKLLKIGSDFEDKKRFDGIVKKLSLKDLQLIERKLYNIYDKFESTKTT